MKAEELFPGALVRVNRDGLCIKKDTIVEVRAVDADDKLIEKGLVGSAHCRPLDDNQFDGGIWCEFLDPIPLTPEILEKNGFETKDNAHYYSAGKIIELLLEEHPFIGYSIHWVKTIETINPIGQQCFIDYYIANLEYVHQLQHALRLCGIEKENTI